jgi:hypothetical protein
MKLDGIDQGMDGDRDDSEYGGLRGIPHHHHMCLLKHVHARRHYN